MSVWLSEMLIFVPPLSHGSIISGYFPSYYAITLSKNNQGVPSVR